MGRHRRESFEVESFEPAYRRAVIAADLADRAARARASLEACRVCPRECEPDRQAGETGLCETARYARVTSAFPHRGEERCLVGTAGSGTVFFSRCNLQCVFCQNADISQETSGEVMDGSGIAALMLKLQSCGCHNINFVSPSHVVPQILEAVSAAVPRGLNVPLVYNSNAYDSVDTLRLLDGIVDIYMPDFKFWSADRAARYCLAEDYPDRARAAIQEMHRQVGDLCTDRNGVATRGLLIRHLVMPGMPEESEAILGWIAEHISPDTYVNIMAQYHPAHRVGRTEEGEPAFRELDRSVRWDEVDHAYEAARRAGLWRFDK
jgi:putative pyruvate formate lyase activating enzyme